MNEIDRLREAFTLELEENPGKPPGPTALSVRMGLQRSNTLNGRLSKERRRLLHSAGFAQDPLTRRWSKK